MRPTYFYLTLVLKQANPVSESPWIALACVGLLSAFRQRGWQDVRVGRQALQLLSAGRRSEFTGIGASGLRLRRTQR